MESQALIGRNEISSNLVDGKPLKSYRKTILGKLLIKTWDSMVGRETEIIFQGDPRKLDESVFHVYSDKERVYFERTNKKHFDSGMLRVYEVPLVAEQPVHGFEQYSDEELKEVIAQRFLAFQASLNKIESVAVLYRMIGLAEDMDKSEKITGAMKARISELQVAEFAPKIPEKPLEE